LQYKHYDDINNAITITSNTKYEDSSNYVIKMRPQKQIMTMTMTIWSISNRHAL